MTTLGVFVGLVFVVASFHMARSVCPWGYVCTGSGLEEINPTTKEAGYCTGNGTTPSCIDPPIYMNGTLLPLVCSEKAASCLAKAEGVYAYPLCDCQKFYTCRLPVGGLTGPLVLYRFICTGNTVFDASTKMCVDDTSVCPHS